MTILEITGFLFGIAGVWLTIKKSIWCFPVGIINVSIVAWLVVQQQLYADFLQQLFYLILLVYGWFRWTVGLTTTKQEIRKSSAKEIGFLIFVFIFSAVSMGYILKTYTPAAFPYLDSAGTVICFIAQWMIAAKRIENWYLWIVANALYIIIYFLKELPLYALLQAIYLVMALIGINEWKKIMKTQVHD